MELTILLTLVLTIAATDVKGLCHGDNEIELDPNAGSRPSYRRAFIPQPNNLPYSPQVASHYVPPSSFYPQYTGPQYRVPVAPTSYNPILSPQYYYQPQQLPYPYNPCLLRALRRTALDISNAARRFDVDKWIADDVINSYDYRGHSDMIETVKTAITDAIENDEEKYNGNYVGLLYAVHNFANKMCHGSHKYYPTVITAFDKVKENHDEITNLTLSLIHSALNDISKLATEISNANNSNPDCQTDLAECNSYIAKIIKDSPEKEILLTQANNLKHMAILAQYYYENYHEKFLDAAKSKTHFKYLIDSRSEIEKLLNAVRRYRTAVGKFCKN